MVIHFTPSYFSREAWCGVRQGNRSVEPKEVTCKKCKSELKKEGEL